MIELHKAQGYPVGTDNIFSWPNQQDYSIEVCAGSTLNSPDHPNEFSCRVKLDANNQPFSITFATGPDTKINVEAVCEELNPDQVAQDQCEEALGPLSNYNGTTLTLSMFPDGKFAPNPFINYQGDPNNINLNNFSVAAASNAEQNFNFLHLPDDVGQSAFIGVMAVALLLGIAQAVRSIRGQNARAKSRKNVFFRIKAEGPEPEQGYSFIDYTKASGQGHFAPKRMTASQAQAYYQNPELRAQETENSEKELGLIASIMLYLRRQDISRAEIERRLVLHDMLATADRMKQNGSLGVDDLLEKADEDLP